MESVAHEVVIVYTIYMSETVKHSSFNSLGCKTYKAARDLRFDISNYFAVPNFVSDKYTCTLQTVI